MRLSSGVFSVKWNEGIVQACMCKSAQQEVFWRIELIDRCEEKRNWLNSL